MFYRAYLMNYWFRVKKKLIDNIHQKLYNNFNTYTHYTCYF